MNLPAFTAEASLYRTSNRYRSSGSEFDGSPTTKSVVAAYFPGPRTQGKCNQCIKDCAKANAACNFLALATIWYPPAAAAAFGACFQGALVCSGWCVAPVIGECCPKVCGFPNPLEPGEGCCDEDEHCVDRYDPNSRQGCCPSDQRVCGGKCCVKGDSCCGDTCCPSNFFCLDGFCSQFPGPLFGSGDLDPPKLPIDPLTEFTDSGLST
jgi:hypothetical protein